MKKKKKKKKAGRECVREKLYGKMNDILYFGGGRGGGGGGRGEISKQGFPYLAVFKKRNSAMRQKSSTYAVAQ